MAAARTEERSSQTYRRSRSFRRAAKSLGQRVRHLRQEQGWTLEEAAERMHLDLKHFQKVEAGLLNVTLVTLVRIADGFGRPVREIFPTK
jgi:transcriptional regulator with XRE-family HTH domain